MRRRRTLLVVLAVLALATPVLAHVPAFPADNGTPERAVAVDDAAKSWSFYDSVDAGEVAYYRVTVDADERLYVGTYTPLQGAFTPSLVVMSPELADSGAVPPQVTVPEGMGAVVVPGERPGSASYEPFAPSANYHTAELSRPVDSRTTFLVAVYEPANRSGPAGVTVGYQESFSVVEYLTVPFDLVRVHAWEGQHPLVLFGPLLGTLVLGGRMVRQRWREAWGRDPVRLAASGAGLLLVATGVNTAVQTALALAKTGPTLGAVVTGVFVLVPLVAGLWLLRFVLRDDFSLDTPRRLAFAIVGLVSLGTWAGFLVGPIVLLGLAALPPSVVDTD